MVQEKWTHTSQAWKLWEGATQWAEEKELRAVLDKHLCVQELVCKWLERRQGWERKCRKHLERALEKKQERYSWMKEWKLGLRPENQQKRSEKGMCRRDRESMGGVGLEFCQYKTVPEWDEQTGIRLSLEMGSVCRITEYLSWKGPSRIIEAQVLHRKPQESPLCWEGLTIDAGDPSAWIHALCGAAELCWWPVMWLLISSHFEELEGIFV